jgi:hypothetical protein
VTVAVEDSSGNINSTASDIVTLAVASGSGTLSGTLSQPAVNGIATFSNLSINNVGGYTLTATDTSALSTTAATSSLFNIADTKLVFLNQPALATPAAPLHSARELRTPEHQLELIRPAPTSLVSPRLWWIPAHQSLLLRQSQAPRSRSLLSISR